MKGSVFHFEKKRQHKFLLNTSLFKVFWKYDFKKFVLGMAFKWDIPIFINWLNIVSNILLFLNLFICLFQIPIEFRKVFSIEKSQISGNNDFNGCFSPCFIDPITLFRPTVNRRPLCRTIAIVYISNQLKYMHSN